MAEFDSYSALSAAIGVWEERTFTSSETDQFIRLFEARANRKLRQDFRRRTSATITTDADGLATLPAGFVGMTSLVRDVSGSAPLKQVSWDALIARNPYAESSDASVYAIYGTTLRVSPVTEDDYLAVFSSVLTGLDGTHTTNWLLALAPDAYLFGAQSAASAKYKDYNTAGFLMGQADSILEELVSQGNVAEYGNATLTLAQAP